MKSHVSMEQKVCIVCCEVYDTGNILLDRRLRESMERETITGWHICPDCEAAYEGHTIFVELDPEKSVITGDKVKTEDLNDAYRTGVVIGIKSEVAEGIFNIELRRVNFIDPETTKMIQAMVNPEVKI